ncbi:MAG: hypothetical protein DRJ68_01585 [Thermoprotei archaeon]|nr:MAG: hypothetical protein DRJ62_00235 [Thermoprotei archaeon]RLF22360.1 MAG: hypothetical protein DRJ68_01585 [Thermoprotei archaeon]
MVATVKCPECGGEMKFDRQAYRYICRSCGLTLTREELNAMMSRRREEARDEREASRREYLKWWLSKK